MKAILVSSFGDSSQLHVGEAPAPLLKPGQVRIRVYASGLNRADIQQRKGFYPPPPGESEILGLEVSGEVVETSSEVTRYKKGDRVMALLAGGGYATEVTVDAGLVLPLPKAFTFEMGAAFMETFLTAHHNIFYLGNLPRGGRCLVHAGASGVGTSALKLLQGYASEVFATVGDKAKAAVCEALGATAIVYKTEDFSQIAKACDVILDPVGGSYLSRNLGALALEGRLVLIGTLGGKSAELDLRTVLLKRLRILGSTLRSLPLAEKRQVVARFEKQFGERLAQGTLIPVQDQVYPFEKVAEAQDRMEKNLNIGKIVLKWD